jgi:hypothetical protein
MTVALLHAPGFGDVGACLRDARQSSGVSVRALAGRPGIAWHTIYLYEKGADPNCQTGTRPTACPNVRTIEEVAAALDVDLVFSGGRWNWTIK